MVVLTTEDLVARGISSGRTRKLLKVRPFLLSSFHSSLFFFSLSFRSFFCYLFLLVSCPSSRLIIFCLQTLTDPLAALSIPSSQAFARVREKMGIADSPLHAAGSLDKEGKKKRSETRGDGAVREDVSTIIIGQERANDVARP
jgi:hypothetical protein